MLASPRRPAITPARAACTKYCTDIQFPSEKELGKIGPAVKGATIIGNGPDALTKVVMVGDDSAMDPGIGTCGKEGQGVPVGVGQPTLRIDGLTVGGTAA